MKSRASKKGKSTVSRKAPPEVSPDHLVLFPFPCPNCDQPIREAKLYCSELCRQEAKFVRYARSCHQDGRDKLADVQEALRIRLAMILSGGYPEQERRLPESTRKAVTERDKGNCCICGKPGNQIDHIRSGSSELDNLQLLCSACHNQKTTAAFIIITPESDPEAWGKAEALKRRINSAVPLRPCDSEEWNSMWHRILAKRRQVIKIEVENEPIDECGTSHPALDYAEVAGLYNPENLDEMSDGEQAEYFALLEGGGDEAWAADMFDFDLSDYR